MTYTVFVTPEVEAVRDETYLYIRSRSPQGADRWFECYEEATKVLAVDPHRFACARESDRLGAGLRQITFGTRRTRPTHRMLFVINNDRVEILALLRRSQRDWGS
jgi:hypothetical protein